MPVVNQYSQEVQKTYTAAIAKLGEVLDFPDGRRYRFALNGATNLAAARLVQAVVPAANHNNINVQAAADVGSLVVSITLGATAVVANEYTDGYMYVNDAGADTTTEGYLYRIKSHPAAAASGVLAVTLYEDNPVVIALTTNSQVTLMHNDFYKTIIHPSPPTALPVGVTNCAVLANTYFWAQTRGLCVMLTDGTITINQQVVPSPSVDGAVSNALLTEATPNTFIQPAIGVVKSVNADTEESLIRLIGLD